MTTPHRGPSAQNETSGLVMSRAVLLRAAADDELDSMGADALQRDLSEHPEDAARIEFERELRKAFSRAMSSETAVVPADLRLRVVAMMGTTPERDMAESLGARHEPANRQPSDPRRRRRARATWLVGALALIVLVGLGIQLSGVLRSPTFAESPERARLALAGFLGTEHRRCALDDRALKRKMTEYQLSEAPAKYQKLLGAELSVANVEQAGYAFLGAGQCVVPGSGASVHLVFRDTDAMPNNPEKDLTCDPTRLSVFIQKDMGELPITPETTYRLGVGENGPLIVVWTRGGLVYYLVTETKAAEDAVLDHLGVAAATRPL